VEPEWILPSGCNIRNKVMPALIDTDQPEFKALKVKIAQLEKANNR